MFYETYEEAHRAAYNCNQDEPFGSRVRWDVHYHADDRRNRYEVVKKPRTD